MTHNQLLQEAILSLGLSLKKTDEVSTGREPVWQILDADNIPMMSCKWKGELLKRFDHECGGLLG